MRATISIALVAFALLIEARGFASALDVEEILSQAGGGSHPSAVGTFVRTQVAETLKKDAEGDCDADCLGKGEEGACQGLFRMGCHFKVKEDNVTIATATRISCVGSFKDDRNGTWKGDGPVSEETSCAGLFSQKTVVGIKKGDEEDEDGGKGENCSDDDGGGGHHHHKCGDDDDDEHHHPDFDVVVFTTYTCGTSFEYSLDKPEKAVGAVSTQVIDCEKAEVYSIATVQGVDMETAEALSHELDKMGVTGAQGPKQNLQYIEGLLTVLTGASADKESSDRSTSQRPTLSTLQLASNEDINATCNGEEVSILDDCDGVFNFTMTEDDGSVVTDTCKGKWRVVGEMMFTCEGKNSYREEGEGDKRAMTTDSTCDGRQMASYYEKEIKHHLVEGSTTTCLGTQETIIKVTVKEVEPSTADTSV